MKTIKKLLWPLIMCAYALLLLWLIITGNIQNYIHPRLNHFLWASTVLLFGMSYLMGKQALKEKKIPPLKLGYIFFAIPFFLVFVATDTGTSANVAAENGLKIYHISEKGTANQKKPETPIGKSEHGKEAEQMEADKIKPTEQIMEPKRQTKTLSGVEKTVEENPKVQEKMIEDSVANAESNEEGSLENENGEEVFSEENGFDEHDNPFANPQDDPPMLEDPFELMAPVLELKEKDGAYQIIEENYAQAMQSIHMDLEKYTGKTFVYGGVVYKQDDFKNKEIVVGRMLMYCCAADAQIVGLLGESEDASVYKVGDWVQVRGLLKSKPYKDIASGYEAEIPYLKIESIKPIPPAKDPYVYFQ